MGSRSQVCVCVCLCVCCQLLAQIPQPAEAVQMLPVDHDIGVPCDGNRSFVPSAEVGSDVGTSTLYEPFSPPVTMAVGPGYDAFQ